MRRVQTCGAALLLAVSAAARAGFEPYPQAVQIAEAPAKTRAQVVAELQEAIHQGRITFGEGDNAVRAPVQTQTIADAFRQMIEPASGRTDEARAPDAAYADDVVVVWGDGSASREQVRAETLQAARLGLLANREDGNFPTTEQLEMIAAAGQRAIAADRTVGSL
jgi:hypothetical protein